MNRKNIILSVIILLFLTAASALFGCEIKVSLSDKTGKTLTLSPGKPVELLAGQTYTLTVIFQQDHGQCLVPADDTVFLLDDEKWKASKDYLGLKLLTEATWEKIGPGQYRTVLTFSAERIGNHSWEIIRDCSRGGYDEIYLLVVIKR